MEAELVLSRSSYRAGTPVVGTVRIHRPRKDNLHSQNGAHSIRDEVLSARLYLAGRSYLGNKHKVSRWRSTQEISNLQKIYGEDGHACLRMAKMEEMAHWQREQNDEFEDNEGLSGIDHRSNTRNYKAIQPPKVTYIEQAERMAIHSHLYPKYSHSGKDQHGGANDYSYLPTFTENNTICFFMTNVLELLDLPERFGFGNFYDDMNPFQPLQLPDLNVCREAQNRKNDSSATDNNYANEEFSGDEEVSHHDSFNYYSAGDYSEEDIDQQESESGDAPTAWQRVMESAKKPTNRPTSSQLEQTRIVLSFRTDLPCDIPPTLSAECIKYFYSAVLVVTTINGEILVVTCPFAVLTANSPYLVRQKSDRDATVTRVHIGELHAVAHSAGLPTLISSSDVSTRQSQLNVIANPPVRNILSRRTAEQRTSTHRIQDSDGALVGWMTLIGIGPLSPGTRLAVCVEFPNLYSGDNYSPVIDCHRVCCGLIGEEYAICETANTPGRADNPSPTKRKTRSYVFDSAYQMVEFGHTDKISMGLVLPLDCPVTVKTDLVEVTVTLKVEFTVNRTSATVDIGENVSSGRDSSELGVIRLDLPCEVVHSGIGLNEDAEDNEEGDTNLFSFEFMSQFWKGSHSECKFNESHLADLNALSLEMIKNFA